jgi:hypothetical protein
LCDLTGAMAPTTRLPHETNQTKIKSERSVRAGVSDVDGVSGHASSHLGS